MTVQYLIDSENVGDFWIPLLELPAEETELVVFYTRNSPHMSYDSLIRLKESNRTVTFIKCYEGTNALDFQLVSELGYRICRNEDGRFVIVTNDTGFDAAVKYWRRRRISVKRITGREAKNPERRIREDLSGLRSPEKRSPETVKSDKAEAVRPAPAAGQDTELGMPTDAWPGKESEDLDGRTSRVNLRDTESAALNETEESFSDADSSFLPEEDLEMDTYEPSDEELNEGTYSESVFEEDDEDAEEEPRNLSFEMNRDLNDLPEEPCFEAEIQDGSLDEEGDAGDRQARIIQAYADVWSVEADSDSMETNPFEDAAPVRIEAEQLELFASSVSDGQDAEQDPEKESAADTENPQDPSAELTEFLPETAEPETAELETAEPDYPDPENTEGADPSPVSETGEYTVPAGAPETGEDTSPAGAPETAEKTVPAAAAESQEKAAPAETTDTAQGLADPEPAGESADAGESVDEAESSAEEKKADSEEETAQEPQHRSKSRRSRSRRSRSSSKKHEQTTDAEQSGGSKEQLHEAAEAEPGPAASGTETDGRPVSVLPEIDASAPPKDEEIARIVACIGADNLAELHNQLATFYGDQGKDIYLSIKNNTRSVPVLKPDLKQKYAYYCEIIFARSEEAGEYPSDISDFLLSVREKLNNLNSLRYALQKQYGKEKGRRFYFLLKPFAKTMYQM